MHKAQNLGEGGQLPGFKVTKEIARLRHSTPGVTLISPPPHHDIYSIEDLAQLIYDLKQVNPKARVGVKISCFNWYGNYCSWCCKSQGGYNFNSGHLAEQVLAPKQVLSTGVHENTVGNGINEANQILTLNQLRHKVTLRTDGGIKTGRDVVMAAMMGAEEFGMGTSSLIAMGGVLWLDNVIQIHVLLEFVSR